MTLNQIKKKKKNTYIHTFFAGRNYFGWSSIQSIGIFFAGRKCAENVLSSGDNYPGGICPGGNCPKGNHPGGNCLGSSFPWGNFPQGQLFGEQFSSGAIIIRGNWLGGGSCQDTILSVLFSIVWYFIRLLFCVWNWDLAE